MSIDKKQNFNLGNPLRLDQPLSMAPLLTSSVEKCLVLAEDWLDFSGIHEYVAADPHKIGTVTNDGILQALRSLKNDLIVRKTPDGSENYRYRSSTRPEDHLKAIAKQAGFRVGLGE